MVDLPRPHLLAYALVLLAVLAFAFRQLGGGARGDGGAPAGAPIRVDGGGSSHAGHTGDDDSARLVVHVAGAVRRPGVYRMRGRARVDDAVARAGGATRRADLTQLNLAAHLEDGRQVVVPTRAPAVAASDPGAVGTVGAAGAAAPLNLNTATAEQLDTLDGVGPVTVQKILQYRAEHGGFSSIEELGQIPGIGEQRLSAIRERVTL